MWDPGKPSKDIKKFFRNLTTRNNTTDNSRDLPSNLSWEHVLKDGIEWEDLKELSRQVAIPPNFRPTIWMDLFNVAYYAREYENVEIIETHRDFRTIEHDIERTLHKETSHRREEFEEELRYVLHKFVSTFPDFGYVQGMNEVAGTLLLVLLNKDITFYAMCSLYDKYNLKLLWDIEMLVTIVQPAIDSRIKQKCRQVYAKMNQLDVRLSDFVPKICIPLFMQMKINMSSRLHIIDWILLGGIKVLRNIIIGMIKLKKNELLACTQNTEFLTVLFNYQGEIKKTSEVVNIFGGCRNRHVDCNFIR